MTKDAQNTRVYAFQGMGVRAIAAPGHLEWLDEFLLPWFESSGRADFIKKKVTLVEDDNAHSALIRAPVVAPGQVGFVLDGPPALLESRRAASGELWFYDEELDVFYRIEGDEIRVVARPGAREGRFSMARLIRELFMERAFATGEPVLHAAAVALNGRAALILGNKGAGKTTLSINCVARLGFGFIANDRVAVLPGAEGHPRVQGIPTLVRVRRSSLPLLPELPWSRLTHRYSSRETLARALELGAEHPANADHLEVKEAEYLSPAQHCWLMNTRPMVGARLGLLLFPQVDATVDGILLERLDPREALAGLRVGAFNNNAEIESSRVFAQAPVTIGPIEQRLTAIAANIPAWRCRLGPRAFEDRDTLVRLMGEH